MYWRHLVCSWQRGIWCNYDQWLFLYCKCQSFTTVEKKKTTLLIKRFTNQTQVVQVILFATTESRMKIIILSWSNIALKQDGTNIPMKREVNLKWIFVEQFVNERLPAAPIEHRDPLSMYVTLQEPGACFLGIGRGERERGRERKIFPALDMSWGRHGPQSSQTLKYLETNLFSVFELPKLVKPSTPLKLDVFEA